MPSRVLLLLSDVAVARDLHGIVVWWRGLKIAMGSMWEDEG